MIIAVEMTGVALMLIVTAKTMTRVMMSGCKSSINGTFLSCYGSLIVSFSFSAFEVLKKSWNTSKGTSKTTTVIDICVYTA